MSTAIKVPPTSPSPPVWPVSSRGLVSWRRHTASASSRRPRWSRRQSARRSTATARAPWRASEPEPGGGVPAGRFANGRVTPRAVRTAVKLNGHQIVRGAFAFDGRGNCRVLLDQACELCWRVMVGQRRVEDQSLLGELGWVKDGVGEGEHAGDRVAQVLAPLAAARDLVTLPGLGELGAALAQGGDQRLEGRVT